MLDKLLRSVASKVESLKMEGISCWPFTSPRICSPQALYLDTILSFFYWCVQKELTTSQAAIDTNLSPSLQVFRCLWPCLIFKSSAESYNTLWFVGLDRTSSSCSKFHAFRVLFTRFSHDAVEPPRTNLWYEQRVLGPTYSNPLLLWYLGEVLSVSCRITTCLGHE